MEDLINKYESLRKDALDKIEKLKLPEYDGVELGKEDYEALGKLKDYEKKLELDKQISKLEKLLIQHRENLMDSISSELEESKKEIEEHKERIKQFKSEKSQKESRLQELLDKEASGEKLDDKEEEEKIDLESSIDALDKKISSRETKIQGLEDKTKDLDTKLKEHQEAYKEQTGKEYDGTHTEFSKEDEKDSKEKSGSSKGGNGFGAPIDTQTPDENKDENKIKREHDSYGTNAEVYSLFLENVPAVKWYNRPFIKKKLTKETSKVLGQLKPEEKEMLMDMFQNEVNLVYFKVPDAYSNAIISSIKEEINGLDKEQDKDKINELNEMIANMSVARDAKNARTNKAFKTLKNKNEILLLGDKNREIREASEKGETEKVKTLANDLKQLVNNNTDVAKNDYSEADYYKESVEKSRGLGNTKLANDKKAFRSKSER